MTSKADSIHALEDPAFLAEWMDGGMLENIKRWLVRTDTEENLFFRREYANIYLKGQKILGLFPEKSPYQDGHAILLQVDFNLARFDVDACEHLSRLCEMGFVLNRGRGLKTDNKLSFRLLDALPMAWWNDFFAVMAELVDAFLQAGTKEDVWADHLSAPPKRIDPILRRKRQWMQTIANANQGEGQGFVYDVEFAQAKDQVDEIRLGLFDILLLWREGEVAKEIWLCNLLLEGDSPYWNRQALQSYLHSQRHMQARRREAAQIWEDKRKMGLLPDQPLHVGTDCPVRLRFIEAAENMQRKQKQGVRDEDVAYFDTDGHWIKRQEEA